MMYGLYVSASGADAQSKRMKVLSNNLANVDTCGFKREMAVLEARFSRAVRDGEDYPGSRDINDLGSGVSMADTMTSFAPGPVRYTGGNLDVAIDGDGFFEVEDGGQKLLTRAGNFQVNSAGELITQQGFRVLSTEGEPIVINLAAGTPKFHSDGWLDHSGGGEFISLVQPRSLGDLARVGENTFRALAPVKPLEDDQRKVKPESVEMSSVNPAQAMVELIETSRAFEANVKLIQSNDQMTGSLLSRILRTN